MSDRVKPKKLNLKHLQDSLCARIRCPTKAFSDCDHCIFEAPLDEFKAYLKAELERDDK